MRPSKICIDPTYFWNLCSGLVAKKVLQRVLEDLEVGGTGFEPVTLCL